MPTEFAQSTALAIRTQIISDENRRHALALVEDAKKLKICGVDDFKLAGEVMNSLGRMRTFLEGEVKTARAPFVEQANKYSEEGKPFIEGVKTAEILLNAEMKAYDRIQQEEKRKAEAERQRLADLARREQEAAAKAIEAAQTNEAFDQAEQKFKKGLEVAEQAKAVEIPQVFKATGAKKKKECVIESFDLSKVPVAYLMLDESKVKKAALAEILGPDDTWVKFRIEESFFGSGR